MLSSCVIIFFFTFSVAQGCENSTDASSCVVAGCVWEGVSGPCRNAGCLVDACNECKNVDECEFVGCSWDLENGVCNDTYTVDCDNICSSIIGTCSSGCVIEKDECHCHCNSTGCIKEICDGTCGSCSTSGPCSLNSSCYWDGGCYNVGDTCSDIESCSECLSPRACNSTRYCYEYCYDDYEDGYYYGEECETVCENCAWGEFGKKDCKVKWVPTGGSMGYTAHFFYLFAALIALCLFI